MSFVFNKYLFIPDSGIGICPVVLVGFEGELAIVWKIINGIVLERAVKIHNLVKFEEGDKRWEKMLLKW